MDDIFTRLNCSIVISRHNEDTKWIEKLDFPNIMIYEKEKVESKYNIPVNKGNEASVYLKYIIDHYDNLPTHIVLLHCHEFSWHHSGSIVNIVDNFVGKHINIENLNHHIVRRRSDLDVHGDDLDIKDDNFSKFFRTYIKPGTGKHILYPDFMYNIKGCSQFIVRKNVIMRHTRKFYELIYEWLITTDVINYWSGRYLEWTWDLSWNKCLINFGIKLYEKEVIIDAYNQDNICVKDDIIKNLDETEYYKVNSHIKITIFNGLKNVNTTYEINEKYIYNKYL